MCVSDLQLTPKMKCEDMYRELIDYAEGDLHL